MNHARVARLLKLIAKEFELAAKREVAKPEKEPEPLIPKTATAQRIAALFNRRPTTEWSEAEVTAWKKIGRIVTMEDLKLIEAYYKAERAKGDGIHRRDLLTFVRHYAGELDRARAHAARKPSRALEWTPTPLPKAPEPSPELEAKIAEQARSLTAKLKEDLYATDNNTGV